MNVGILCRPCGGTRTSDIGNIRGTSTTTGPKQNTHTHLILPMSEVRVPPQSLNRIPILFRPCGGTRTSDIGNIR
jgi:hypothetical protein